MVFMMLLISADDFHPSKGTISSILIITVHLGKN